MLGNRALAGKHAVITGGSKGIGLAIAKAFAQQNAAKISIVGRNLQSLEKAKNEIIASNSESNVTTHQGAVGDRNMWTELVKKAKDIDILVNSAGISHASLFVSTTPSLVEEVYQTNLLGTTWGCQIVAKAMMRSRRTAQDPGCIINVASLLGLKGGKGSVAYAASKAGVIGLTRSLAAELGTFNIRFNAIVPGYIETEMTEAMHSEARAEALRLIPQNRFGTPEEVAHAAVFLATNTYANNCVLNLDGALSAT